MEQKGSYPHPAPAGFTVDQQNQMYPNAPPDSPPKYDQIHNQMQASPAPQPPPIMTTTVIQQTVKSFGPNPQATYCHNCNKEVLSEIKHKPGTKTHLFAVLLCLIFWPCVCVPYCCDSCQNTNHYCPSCQQYLGTYQQ